MDEDEHAHGGDRPRRSALARDRQEGAERPARVAADAAGSSTCAASPRRRTRRGARGRRSRRSPDIGDVTAELLYQNGFKSAEELAASDEETVGEIDGIGPERAGPSSPRRASTSPASRRTRRRARGAAAAAADAAAQRACREPATACGERRDGRGGRRAVRGGPGVSEHVPIRTCVGCGARAPQAALVRFVAARRPPRRRSRVVERPGRGAYLHRDAGVLDGLRRAAAGRSARSAARRHATSASGSSWRWPRRFTAGRPR